MCTSNFWSRRLCFIECGKSFTQVPSLSGKTENVEKSSFGACGARHTSATYVSLTSYLPLKDRCPPSRPLISTPGPAPVFLRTPGQSVPPVSGPGGGSSVPLTTKDYCRFVGGVGRREGPGRRGKGRGKKRLDYTYIISLVSVSGL